jgi:heme oxygenase
MQTLREATAEKHRKAEQMPFNIKMFKGQLSEEDYLLYLVQQLEIFKTIEEKGLPSEILKRCAAIEDDINELIAKGNTSTKLLSSTLNYTEYLSGLNYQETLPHIYLNYLALMFGGQIMKKKVPSAGRMYDFENQKEGIKAVRAVQKDTWGDEVNKAYDYIISIFDELDQVIAAV